MQPQQSPTESDRVVAATAHTARRTDVRSGLLRDAHLGQWLGVAAISVLAPAWFTMAWRMQGKPLLDATGEAIGGVSMLLLGVAIVGTIRRSGR